MLADTPRHRLLTHDEELSLGRRIQAGDRDALDELVSHNILLVHKVARSWGTSDPGTTYDDLVQQGMLGLLTAARKFDPARGHKFSTYAVWWIRQHIARAAITAGTIRRSASPNYQAVRPGVIRSRAIRQAPIARLDAPLVGRKGDEGGTLADILADSSTPVEEQVLSQIEAERLLQSLHLSPRALAVVRDWLAGIPRGEAQALHGVSRSYIYSMLEARKERLMSTESTPCLVEGCDQPRMISDRGVTLPRCAQHQREYWNDAAKAARDRKREAEPAPSANGTAPRRRGRPAGRSSAAPVDQPFVEQSPAPVEPPTAASDCATTCSAATCPTRAALEIVAARFPEVRDLIAAIEKFNRYGE